MLLPVLPAIPSYVLMWRAGDVYRADTDGIRSGGFSAVVGAGRSHAFSV